MVRALLVALMMSSLAGCGRKAARLAAERARVEAAASAASAAEAASAAAVEAAAEAEEARAATQRIESYKRQVTHQLRDPDSAQFQNLRLVHGQYGEALCGDVNAKNGFGGYVGYTRFAVTEHPISKEGDTVHVFSRDGGMLTFVDELVGDQAGCWPRKAGNS